MIFFSTMKQIHSGITTTSRCCSLILDEDVTYKQKGGKDKIVI